MMSIHADKSSEHPTTRTAPSFGKIIETISFENVYVTRGDIGAYINGNENTSTEYSSIDGDIKAVFVNIYNNSISINNAYTSFDHYNIKLINTIIFVPFML